MSKQGGCSKAGNTKDKPSQKAYTATMRWERNKRHRIEREARLQAANAALRPARLRLRKAGALRRINRRLAAAIAANKPTDALLKIQQKCAAALSTNEGGR